MADFSVAYVKQAEQDYGAMINAEVEGRLRTLKEAQLGLLNW